MTNIFIRHLYDIYVMYCTYEWDLVPSQLHPWHNDAQLIYGKCRGQGVYQESFFYDSASVKNRLIIIKKIKKNPALL